MAQSSNTGHAAELMLSAIEANRDRDKFNRLVCAMKEAGIHDSVFGNTLYTPQAKLHTYCCGIVI